MIVEYIKENKKLFCKKFDMEIWESCIISWITRTEEFIRMDQRVNDQKIVDKFARDGEFKEYPKESVSSGCSR
jgi:hypothetical protein